MKKARLLKCLVIICIILSFFSSVYALGISDPNSASILDEFDTSYAVIQNPEHQVLAYNDQRYPNTLEIGAIAELVTVSEVKADFSFTMKESGLYTIDIKSLEGMSEDKELDYKITDSTGRYLRLAAFYNDYNSQYEVISAKDDSRTTIDVWLKAGETYKIELTGGARDFEGLIVIPSEDPSERKNQYEVTLTRNTEAYGEIYQSDISSLEITDPNSFSFTGSNMEDVLEGMEIPDGATVSFDGDGGIVSEAVGAVTDLVNDYLVNPLEETICELLLGIGDYLVNLINKIIGEEVTITNLVYNQVDAVNANFFDASKTGNGVTASLKESINEWYNIFRLIAITVYIVVLLAIGIHILLSSTGNGMAKAKELLTAWIKGLAYFIIVPYFIKYAFMINDAIVEMLREESAIPSYKVGSFDASSNEWSAEAIEFRSPEYVSKYTGQVAFGSDEASVGYMKKIRTYQQNFDLMRIMRAYAGVTKKLIYTIIWFILIGQLIAFIVMYYKRYFMIAFLIAVFPIIAIFHAISIAKGREGPEISSWMKEMFTNIFMQMIQAIIYTIITHICITMVQADLGESSNLNWIIIIIAINFVSEGEKLLRKIVGSIGSGSTVGGVGQSGQGIKGAFNRGKQNIQRLITGVHPKKKDEE